MPVKPKNALSPEMYEKFIFLRALAGDGEAATALQRALCAVGCIVEITGVFDAPTAQACRMVPDVILLPAFEQEMDSYGKTAKP